MERVCEICGKTFETGNSKQKFCSRECNLKHQRLKYRDAHPEPPKPNLPERNCEFCDKEFFPQVDNQKFCSKKCRQMKYNTVARQISYWQNQAKSKGLRWDGDC